VINLRLRIQDEMKDAMRAKEEVRLLTIRHVWSEVRRKEIDDRAGELTDDAVLAVIEKLIKQRKESCEQFSKGNREDLVEKEQAELLILQSFLPEPLPKAAVLALVSQAITETNATGIKDMGRVMAYVKPQVQGRTDMQALSQMIKDALTGTL
jgi:uncharacterized protein YqeY